MKIRARFIAQYDEIPENADALRAELRMAGYEEFTLTSILKDGKETRKVSLSFCGDASYIPQISEIIEKFPDQSTPLLDAVAGLAPSGPGVAAVTISDSESGASVTLTRKNSSIRSGRKP